MRNKPRTLPTVVLSALLVLALSLLCGPALADTWTRSASGGIGGTYNQFQSSASSSAYFTDWTGTNCLFVGTRTPDGTGCEIWRYDPVGIPSWTQVNLDGFGNPDNEEASVMATYSHGVTTYLYVGTWNRVTGCEVWRTAG